MKFKLLVFLLYIALCNNVLRSQDRPIKPKMIGKGVFLGETKALKDLPALTPEEIEFLKDKALKKAARKVIKQREYPYASTAYPRGNDAAWQKTMGETSTNRAPLVNFEGQTTSSFPPDCNGTIGPNHYMQTVNTTYAIYSRTGTLLAGPTNMNLLFNGVSGATCNDGDPLIQYDEQAQRWVAVEFSLCGSNDLMLMAVSSTNDPTGTWYAYSFDVADMPDYEKIGIWQDGYYMGTNTSSGNDIYVFERSKMLTGAANPQMVAFDNAWRPGTGFLCVPPLDNDGPAAPAGTPGMFIAFNDDAVAGGSDQLWIYNLTVNWTTPASSAFVRTQQIPVTAFDSQFNANWDDITQPGTQKLDGVPQVIMNAPQYRNFGTYQTIVCCHTVDVDATNHAGIRWYELRKTTGNWSVRQSGTFAPDAASRWMGSIMLNGSGKIGLAYSIASSTIYAGIRYCGQSAAAYANASGILDIPEEIIQNGTVSQTTYNRWGDYALLSVDPTDDETFWFTSEYVKTGGTLKGTKIASFRFGNNPVVSTLNATSVTGNSATLNGTVNPNGLATNYYFQWGTTLSYGNTTATTSAGSGSVNIAVNANISGLTAGTTYHFRLVAVNSDGTSYGNDLNFTPGAAIVTTASISAVSLISATGGGNVITDGGSAITARGVCWSTGANPTIANSKTIDGSGTGIFNSSITGLTANTTYHTRAYATNAAGTFYGGDSTFTTLCSIFTLPFIESFSGTTLPNCWSIADNQGNGQIWRIGTITDQSPNPILNTNYAYLNSDSLGSGNSQNTDIITPTLNLSSYSSVTLQFNHYFKSYTGSSGNLYYSINGGSSWVLISSFTATSASNPVAFNQVISAVAGQAAAKFKWNYTGTWGYYWAIDDINITGINASLPILSTSVVTSITTTSAISGGTISSAGASSVTARGVCWGTVSGPLVTGSHTTDGTGTGSFTSSINGILPSTTYFVRAYATNASGTAYGNELSFTTSSGLPILTTTAITSLTNTSAAGGGNISYAGTSIVTARGVCWATTANPIATGNHTTDGSGTGSFTSNITGLTTNTTYHVRAYATNASGTAYGNNLTFTTTCGIINTFPWTEGFENAGVIPNCWTQEQVNNSGLNWVFGAGNGGSNPATAHTGSYNARLKDANAADNKTKLITPTLNLSSINNPILKFWHTQQYWSPDQDTLIIFYKTSSTGNWTQLVKYSNSITSWTLDSVYLPSPSADYYIAFEGNAKYGYGVCIDDVSVTGTSCTLPDNAGNISGLSNICQGQNNVIYTVPAIANATSYVWTLPNAAVGSSLSNSISVNYSNTAVSGFISVSGMNNCGNGQASNLSVTVNPLPGNAPSIAGLSTVCQGQNNVNYSITPIPNATSYIWTSASGFSGSSSTNSIAISYSNAAISGNITVKGINSCGESNVSTFPVTVNQLPAAAGAISGAANVCQEQSLVYYSVPLINNATSYIWSFPSGASGVANLNEIYLDFNAAAVSGNISVKGTNSCGEGSISSFPVVVNPLPLPAGSISGSTSVCQEQQNVVYTINQIPYATSYLWTLPPGANGSSISDSISLNFNNTLNPAIITVRGINNCGEGEISTLSYTINPKPDAAGVISGLTEVCKGQNNVQYSVPLIYNATSYIWNLPSGTTGNSISNNIIVNYTNTATSGIISVKGNNNCGDSAASSVTVNVNSLPAMAGNIMGTDTIHQGQNNLIYSIPTINNAVNYIWTLPPNVTGNSNSNSILLSFPDSCISGNLTVKGLNNCGEGEPASKYLKIYKQLEVKLFLEGLFSSASLRMNKTQDNTGDHFTDQIADTLSLSLYHSYPPYLLQLAYYHQAIDTSGYIKVKSPSEINDTMFIGIKQRNHLETWSVPVSFASDTITYDFTTSASKAFGNNQKLLAPGIYGIYAGDVNQDALVDGSDLSDTETDNNNFVTGYIATDINGDGLIDGSDLSLVETNNNNFVGAITP